MFQSISAGYRGVEAGIVSMAACQEAAHRLKDLGRPGYTAQRHSSSELLLLGKPLRRVPNLPRLHQELEDNCSKCEPALWRSFWDALKQSLNGGSSSSGREVLGIILSCLAPSHLCISAFCQPWKNCFHSSYIAIMVSQPSQWSWASRLNSREVLSRINPSLKLVVLKLPNTAPL